MRSEFEEAPEGLGVVAFLHEPARGLGAEEDAEEKGDRGQEGGAELEAPGDLAGILESGRFSQYEG